VAPAYGLPSAGAQAAGQFTSKGMVPYPLDESFHTGLKECGVPATEATHSNQ
jgi:hypothetical protein